MSIVADRNENPALSKAIHDFVALVHPIIEPVTEAQAWIARQAYRDYGKGSGHPAQLNFGDCFSYALAKDRDEPLLYKGNDFIHTDIRVGEGDRERERHDRWMRCSCYSCNVARAHHEETEDF